MKNLIFVLLLLLPIPGSSDTTDQHVLVQITRELHRVKRRMSLVEAAYGESVDTALRVVKASIEQLDDSIAAKKRGEDYDNYTPPSLEKYMASDSESLSNGISPPKKSLPLPAETTPIPSFYLNRSDETKPLPSNSKWRSDFIALGENGLLYSSALTEFLNSLQSWQSGAAKIQFLNLDKDAVGFTGVLVIYPTVKERDAEKK